MPIFRLVCSNGTNTKRILYNSGHTELLDEDLGYVIYFPNPVEHELEANANSVEPSDLMKLNVHEYKRMMSDITNPYLGNYWNRIRKFYDTGRNKLKPNTPKYLKCTGCPVAQFCAGTNDETDCSKEYEFGKIQLSTAVHRLTQYHVDSIGCTTTESSVPDNSIVYSPLWLGTLPPEVGIDRLMGWSTRAKPEQKRVLATIERTGTIYDAGYDLDMDGIFIGMVTHPLTGEWFADFDKHFPELVSFFARYPLKNLRITCAMTRARPEVDIPDFYHMDWDTTSIGFRFYAVKDKVCRLSFKRLRNSYQDFYTKRLGRRYTVPTYHARHREVRAKTLPGPHAWCLNVENTTHSVDGYHNEPRSVFLLYGDVDQERYNEIQVDSSIMYYKNVMRMSDLD